MSFYTLLWLFFGYSFLGWILETVLAALTRRHFVNRGVLTGPICARYGIFICLCSILGYELQHGWFFLFIGCGVLGSWLEWLFGRSLEKLGRRRWWDYSHHRFHLDGYVSLRSAVVNGAVGVLCLHYVNPLMTVAQRIFPSAVVHIVLWVSLAVFVLDLSWNLCTILGLPQRLPHAENVHNRLLALTLRITLTITRWTENRLHHSYPSLRAEPRGREKSTVFASGCCFSKLVWLFVVGSLLGDITETLFCRFRAGVWMNRSSLVWGPFSIVWGFAIAMATLLLYNYRDRPDGVLFSIGTVLGGVYEYVCSVASELVFGQIFWDYSEIPFNLGGRINLLYCFFWGIAAVVWLKKLYPPISGLIEKIPLQAGRPLTVLLIVFMAANMTVSAGALYRSGARDRGEPPVGSIGIWLDEHYGDDVLTQIYPNSISTVNQ